MGSPVVSKRHLLYIPVLSPLLVVTVIAAINWHQPIRLRLFTWTGPNLPVGAWLMLAGGSGMILGFAGTILVFRQPWRRWVLPKPQFCIDNSTPLGVNLAGMQVDGAESAMSECDFGGRFPTITVPFRILRRGSSHPVSSNSARTNSDDSGSAASEDWGYQSDDDW